MLNDRCFREGHLPDFRQGLEYLSLLGEIDGYCNPIFLAPLHY